MTENERRAVINNRDYDAAKSWYAEYGKDSFLKLLIGSDSDGTFASRIFMELDSWTPLKEVHSQAHAPEENTPIESVNSSFQSDLTKLKYIAGQHFKAMKEERLKIFDEDKEVRRLAAKRVLELRALNIKTWQDIEFLKTNGTVPEESKTEPIRKLSTTELIQLKNRHEKYIRKFSKKHRDSGVSDRVLIELKKRKQELHRINKEIATRWLKNKAYSTAVAAA